MTKNIFNKSQKNALAALGLPLWQKRAYLTDANLATPNSTTKSLDEKQPSADLSHGYRLGPWLLLFAERLPVNHPQWLVDFALALGQASSAVIAEVPSASKEQWDKAFIVTFNVGIQETIPAMVKAKLWNQIQQNAS